MKPTFASKNQETISLLFAAFVFLFSFGFLFYRSHFGVDFFDEPYYSALALRLALGQKLFVDELFLAQTFSSLTFPFVKIYLALNHSLEGIIFFMRMMNFVFYLIVGGVTFFVFQKTLGKSIALLIAASVTLFFTGNMTTLGYNSLGTGFLTLALLISFSALSSRQKGLMLMAGLLMGLACISYVTFGGMALLFFFYLLAFEKDKTFAIYFASGVALALAFPAFFIFTHWESFLKALAFGKEYSHGTPQIAQVFEVLHKFFPKKVLVATVSLVGVASFVHKKYTYLFDLVLIGVPLLSNLCCYLASVGWSGFPFYLAFFSLIAFFRLKDSDFSKFLLRWIFIPSMVAGLITSVTSASGIFNAQVGLLPAALVGLIFLSEGLKNKKSSPFWTPLLPLSFPVFLLLLQPLNVWSDADFKFLTEKITAGPYRGLYTAAEKRLIAEESFRVLKPLLSSASPVLIYPNGPSGYLIQPVPPAQGVTWYQNSGRTNQILAELYKKQINPQSRVIRMKVWYLSPTVKTVHHFEPGDILNDLIESTHHPIQETDWFTVFAPNLNSPRN